MPVPFNESKVDEYATPPSPARGQHVGMLVDAQRHESDKNDNLMSVLFIQKMTDPDNPESVIGPKVRNYLTFPLDNPDVEGHEVPDWAPRMFVNVARCFSDDVPEMPQFDRDSRTWSCNGEVLETKEEVRDAKHAAISAAGQFGSELWGEAGEGVSRLVGTVVYYDVDYDAGSDFPSVGGMYAECPEDWELTDEVTERISVSEKAKGAEKSAKSAKGRKKTGGKTQSRRGRK